MRPTATRILNAIAPYLDRGERFNGTKLALQMNINQGGFVDYIFELVSLGILRRVKPGHYVWDKRPDDLVHAEQITQPKPPRRGPNLAPGITLAQVMGRR